MPPCCAIKRIVCDALMNRTCATRESGYGRWPSIFVNRKDRKRGCPAPSGLPVRFGRGALRRKPADSGKENTTMSISEAVARKDWEAARAARKAAWETWQGAGPDTWLVARDRYWKAASGSARKAASYVKRFLA